MTVKELSQLYYLNREIESDQKELEELEAKIGPRVQQLTGMPHGSNIGNPEERMAIEIADLKAIIAAKQIQCIHERNRLERFISGVEESRLRMAFRFRFINGLSWRQVAAHLGDVRCEDSIKKQVYRYLKADQVDEMEET